MRCFVFHHSIPLILLYSQASEVEETLKRIRSHRGVEGILIVNHDGISLKSTLSAEQTTQYASLFSQVRVALLLFCCSALPAALCPVVVVVLLVVHQTRA